MDKNRSYISKEIRLEKTVYERLMKIAKKQSISYNRIINKALDSFLMEGN